MLLLHELGCGILLQGQSAFGSFDIGQPCDFKAQADGLRACFTLNLAVHQTGILQPRECRVSS